MLTIPALLALVVLGTPPAHAGIESTSGNITIVNHPTGTLTEGDLESDTEVYAWFERKISSPGQQDLDHTGAGLVDSGASLSPGSVTPNVAESYIVHFDQASDSTAIDLGPVSITFRDAILGVWHSNSGLSNSDTQWAPTNLTYSTGLNFRQYEIGSDQFRISTDLKTLTIVNTRTVNTGVDQLRVLVNPEPATFAFMGLGVLGLGALVGRRRRRRTAIPAPEAQQKTAPQQAH